MAIDIEFRGIGDDVLATIREAAELTAKLRGEVVAANDAQTKGAQQVVASQQKVQATLEGSVAAAEALGKQTVTNSRALTTEVDKAAASAQKLEGALTEVERTDLQRLVNEARAVAAAEGTVVKALSEEKRARVDQLVSIKAITQEEAKLLTEALEVTEALKGQPQQIATGARATAGLREQFRQARAEAQQMVAQFGRFSPQAQEALRRAAALKDELGDFNDTLDALNPDAKFAAFGQVLSSVAGAFTAAQGAAALFGDENEDIQRGILKLQGALAVTQGLQAFFGGFSDGLKNIRTLLGLTTAAQVASTTATEADTVAKGTNAAATVAVGTANTTAATGVGVFTGALRTLGVVIAANPIGAIAVGLAAIAGLFIALGDDAEDATADVDRLLTRLNLVSDQAERARRFTDELRQIQNELDDLGADDTPALQRQAAIRRQQQEVDALNDQLVTARENQERLLQQIEALDRNSDTFEENNARLEAALEEQQTIIDEASAERIVVRERTRLELAKIDDKENDEAKEKAEKAAEDRKRIAEKLGDELEAIQRNVADRIKAIEFEEANPEQRLALQRAAAEEEVEDLRRSELRKLAILELVKERRIKDIDELSQKEKDAIADAEIARRGLTLSPEQEQQFQRLSLATWDKYFKDLTALQREQAEQRIALVADTNEKEALAFEIALAAQTQKLREEGIASEQEINDFKARQREEFGRQQAQQAIDIETEIAIARVEAIKAGGDQSAQAQQAAELQILQIKLKAAQDSLALIATTDDAETRLKRANLEKAIAELQQAIDTAQARRAPVDIFKLLGIEFDSDEQRQAVEEAVRNVVNLVEASIAAQRAEVDAQISATDELIADRERRSEDLQQRLDQEIELAKLGLANNVELVQRQIAENERAAQAEKDQRAKLLEDRKKVARQQLAIDAAQQASALVTAGAEVFKFAAATGGILAVISSIGFIASVLSAFTALRAKAAAISSGGPSFRKGGLTEGLIDGPSHEEGGIGLYARGRKVGEMEGGEFIVNRKTSLTHRDIVEAMNDNDIARVYELARLEVIGANGLSSEAVKDVVNSKQTLERHTTTVHIVENEKLRQEVKALTKEVRGMRKESAKPKDQIVPITPEGYHIFKGDGSRKTVRRKR